MIIETIYSESDLESGRCKSCGEFSHEILKRDGRCIDCIEEDRFIRETMRNDPYNRDPEDLEDW